MENITRDPEISELKSKVLRNLWETSDIEHSPDFQKSDAAFGYDDKYLKPKKTEK